MIISDAEFARQISSMKGAFLEDFEKTFSWHSTIFNSFNLPFALQNENEKSSFEYAPCDVIPLIDEYTVFIDGLYFSKSAPYIYTSKVYGLNKTDKVNLILLDVLYILLLNDISFSDITITVSDISGNVLGSWYSVDKTPDEIIKQFGEVNSRLCNEVLEYMRVRTLSSTTPLEPYTEKYKEANAEIDDYVNNNKYGITREMLKKIK